MDVVVVWPVDDKHAGFVQVVELLNGQELVSHPTAE
jgi:hypothetical protein